MRDADDKMTVGEYVRTIPNGPIYRVDMVSESRARLVRVSDKAVVNDDWEEEGGKAINVSPNAHVIRVKKEDVIREAEASIRKETKMNAVPIPVGTSTVKEREKERRDTMAKAKSAKKTNGGGKAVALVGAAKAARDKASSRGPKPTKTVRECLCGCGGETTGYFVPGHDARYKSWMVQIERGTKDITSLPKAVQKANEFKKRGDGFVTVTNYKGEKHAGYDKHA